jgi:UDP-N-acetylmuramate dehydrogenase
MIIRKNTDLRKYTTFKIGGRASYFVEVFSVDELIGALSFSKQKKLPVVILGGGSNILFPDNRLKAVVIKINLLGIKFKGPDVKVMAGENWDRLVKKSLDHGLYGLENLSGIPGTVGAAPIQNIGAYGAEAGRYIKKVKALNKKSLKLKEFSRKECKFRYRDSFFKTKRGQKYLILEVVLSLDREFKANLKYKDLVRYCSEKKRPKAKDVRKAVLKIRSRKFPNMKKFGTAGSFFKNPIITKSHYSRLLKKHPQLPNFKAEKGKVRVPLGYILDKILNLTDFRQKQVGLYKNQPLVFINYKKGTQKDILKLKKEIERKVFQKTKIKIFPEVTFI